MFCPKTFYSFLSTASNIIVILNNIIINNEFTAKTDIKNVLCLFCRERNHWLLAIVAFPGLIVNGKLESIKMPYRIDQNIAKFAKIERQPLMKK